MKSEKKRLSYIFVIALTLFVNFGYAATTNPVGAVSKQISAGTHLLSVPFVNEAVYQGSVQSISGDTIGLIGLQTLPDPAYILVSSGNASGQVASITSSTLSSVTIEAEISGLSVDDQVVIHPHISLSDISTFIAVNQGDTIALFNPDGTQLVCQYFDGYGWYAESLDANVDGVAVYPGEAFLLKTAIAREAIFYGSVTTKSIAFPISGGRVINLVGTLDPVNGQTLASTFPNAVTGDSFSAYTTSGGSLQNIFNAQFFEGFGWYNEVDDSYMDTELIGSTTGSLLKSSAASEAVFSPAYNP